MDVNNIVCCGFNKAYSILKDSKKGSLSDANLYSAALFSYQVSVLENHVSTEYSCLTDSQFDKFSQKMQSCCGCCGETGEEDTNASIFLNACPVCANVAHFVSQPENDGVYVDDDSLILLNYSNGVFSQYFQKIGNQFTPYDFINGSNVRNGVYIDNPTSLYHGKVAISRTDQTAPYQSYIEIWDVVDGPVTPQLVISFPVESSVFTGSFVNGKIDYSYDDDAIYYQRINITNLYKLDILNGTVTIVNSSLSGLSPNGDYGGNGITINPINKKRYVVVSGSQVSAPDSGAVGILDDTNTLVDVFPFNYPIDPLPTPLWFVAPSCAIVFDAINDVYMVSRTNSNYYYYTRNDVIKIDGSTNSYITTFNYDNLANPIWVPLCDNGFQNTRSTIQYYDGTGFISGEKVLVLYRNRGPLINTFNLILNGDFATATDWSFLPIPGPSGWAIGAGVATHTPGNAGSIYQYIGSTRPTAGVNKLTFDITVNASYIDVYAGAVLVAGNINATGSYTFTFNSPVPAFNLEFIAQSAFDGSIDNVTLSNPLIPDPFGNTWTSFGNAAKLVAFDINTGASTDIITIPDTIANAIDAFNYNYTYNKIFFSAAGQNVLAYDQNGLKIYQEACFGTGFIGGFVYSLYDIKESGRILALSTSNDSNYYNMAVIEPVTTCTEGRVNIINEGIYTFDYDAGEWVGVVQNSNLLQLGNQFTLSATINIPTGYLTVEYTFDFQNWGTLNDVTGSYSFTPAQLDAGLVFLNPSDDPFWIRIKINTEDNCTVYGEIIPDPPPAPDFEGVPTSIYRYNSVDFEDLSVGFPTSWSWQFEGGTPLTSTVENPAGIAYNTLGTFDVGLTVTNANGSRSLTKSNYVNVIDGYLINYVSGASAAYSLRKVNIAYTGPAILVRRDSDNATLNIGFVGEELDTAALLAFCTLSNGFVQIWYDQSQLGRHATQVVFGEQPQIVSGGVIIETNSKPSVFFDGIDDSLLFTFPFASAPFSTSIVGRQTLNTGARPIITGTTTNNQFTMSGSIAGIIVTANAATDSFPGGTSTAQKHVAYYRNGVSAKSAYENGSVLAIGSNGITNQSVLYTSLSGLAGANRFGGEVQEIIMYDSYKVSSNTIIQTNVNDYYNIY
jgi:PKD repeat protein